MSDIAAFCRVLREVSGFEVVGDVGVTPKQVRFRGRVHGVSRVWTQEYVDAILDASEDNARWSSDISRHYFKRGGPLRWAWRIIITAGSAPIDVALNEFLQVLREVTATAQQVTEVMEVPLFVPHAKSNIRPDGRRGKGVWDTKESL